MSRPEATGVRTISVQSPSARRETKIFALAALQIAFWSSVVVANSRTGTSDPAASLQADEIAFAKLDADEQRIYRRALEGMQEIEDWKARSGDWPAVADLAKRGIPPFAEDPIDRYEYRWQLVRDNYAINYVGIPKFTDPTHTGRPTIVIALITPEPGQEERVPVDETHHELNDGTMIHVGVWRGTAREVPAALSQFPFLDGWRRIAMGAP